MDRNLDSLSSDFRPKIDRVLAKLVERNVPVMIVQTSRTMEEHRANLANGTSRTSLSKHLLRSMRGFNTGTPDDAKCDAIDLCPWEHYEIHGPDKLAWIEHATPESTAAFAAIGEIGEAEGCRWGGRWIDPHDPGHLEFIFPTIV
jgi:hypothetical protein